jgi:regulatory protein
LLELNEETALRQARYQVLRLLSRRQRSIREVELFLRRKGFEGPVIEASIREMLRLDYLNDSRYAGELLHSFLRRGFGPFRARLELERRGIEREIIENGITRFFHPEEDLQRARSLVAKRTVTGPAKGDARWLRRQAAYLQRRGFDRRVISAVLREYGVVSPE